MPRTITFAFLAAVVWAAVVVVRAEPVRFKKRAPGTKPTPVAGLGGLDDLRGALDQFGKKGLPPVSVEVLDLSRSIRLRPFSSGPLTKRVPGSPPPPTFKLNLTAAELVDVARLALEAYHINAKAQRAMAQRKRELAARGIAEVPASTAACRYDLDLGDKGSLVFDQWGEFYIDRRFVSEKDMVVVHKLEAYYRKAFASTSTIAQPKPAPKTVPPRSVPAPKPTVVQKAPPVPAAALRSRADDLRTWKVPIFRGFEDDRYQMHDALILKLTADFNANKAQWIGGTPAQAAKVGNLTPALVKSHMIEESGGNGPMSLAAWRVDPQQVNVPGDWADVKLDLGLSKPTRRNEGTLEGNVRAAIMFLARKGFGVSGQPTARRQEGFFDGWPTALQRYNARRDRTLDNRYYSEAYSDKIRSRAANPNVFVPIEIKLAVKKGASK